MLALAHPSVLPSALRKASALGVCFSRGSMAGLCVPLPTLRPCPYGQRRTARGRCGSLLLHRGGLAPPTPRRSPGAPATKQSRSRAHRSGLLRRFAPRNDGFANFHYLFSDVADRDRLMSAAGARPLSILHVFRAPVGGLFRHVLDLVRGQTAAGHRVGIVADATTGGERAEAALTEIAPLLALGITRVAMSRHLGLSDVSAVRRVAQAIRASGADVVHGHGAKGGAYARLAGSRALRAYTPHGGSLHFDPRTPIGFVYLTLERALLRRTDLILFES